MKIGLLYVSHSVSQREAASKADPNRKETKWQVEWSLLDDASGKVMSVRTPRMDMAPVFDPKLKRLDPVTVELRVVRGDWEDELGIKEVCHKSGEPVIVSPRKA